MEYIIISLVAVNVLQGSYLIAKSGIGRASRRQKPVFIDSSVLIDGRIQAIAEAGFVQGDFFIPRSVLAELQYMADNADGEKRTRARHGLDVAAALQSSVKTNVRVHHDPRSTTDGVDNQLLALAEKYNGSICTVDFNLNKVAQVEGIAVLNVNELARHLRADVLPGETIKLQVVQKGNEAQQGVGYLENGTMVVVDRGAAYIGKVVEVEVVRSLQTDAGRMLFAKIAKQQSDTKTTEDKNPSKQNSKADSKQKPVGRKPKRQRSTSNEDRMVELANR